MKCEQTSSQRIGLKDAIQNYPNYNKKMKTPKIRPRGKQVLVKPEGEKSRESFSGLVMPSNVEQEQRAIGTVVSVGPEIKDIKKGDRVIYGAYAGEKIKLNEGTKEVDYVLLFDEDVLAFLED